MYITSGTKSFAMQGSRYGCKGYVYLTEYGISRGEPQNWGVLQTLPLRIGGIADS